MRTYLAVILSAATVAALLASPATARSRYYGYYGSYRSYGPHTPSLPVPGTARTTISRMALGAKWSIGWPPRPERTFRGAAADVRS